MALSWEWMGSRLILVSVILELKRFVGQNKECISIFTVLKVQRVWVRNTSGRNIEFNMTSDCPDEVKISTRILAANVNSGWSRFALIPWSQSMIGGQANLEGSRNVMEIAI
jgi:hypothetical protein